MAQPIVVINNLTKSFKIPLEASSGIKQKLINILKGRKGYRVFTPLKDIDFTINEGDFFGIVGRNGSGKSTLLKTIAGIYTPNSGSVEVGGSLVPFIELGVGFNPELTGRENVFLNGALLGFSHDEMEALSILPSWVTLWRSGSRIIPAGCRCAWLSLLLSVRMPISCC